MTHDDSKICIKRVNKKRNKGESAAKTLKKEKRNRQLQKPTRTSASNEFREKSDLGGGNNTKPEGEKTC